MIKIITPVVLVSMLGACVGEPAATVSSDNNAHNTASESSQASKQSTSSSHSQYSSVRVDSSEAFSSSENAALSSSSSVPASSSATSSIASFEAIPARMQAEDYTDYDNEDATRSGDLSGPCSFGEVDLAGTDDNDGGCSVGWTRAGEALFYNIETNSDGEFDFIFRISSNAEGKTLSLTLDGAEVGVVTASAEGWNTYSDQITPKVFIPAGQHEIKITFDTGGTNFNYFDILDYLPERSTSEPPAQGCTLNKPKPGIPEITLFTPFTKSLARADFCQAKKWYDEQNGQQIFSLHKGDDYSKNVEGGRQHARIEAQHGLRFKPNREQWHEFEANMLIDTKPQNTITVAQLFAGCCGPDARVEMRTGGSIHVGSLLDGNKPLSDGENYIGKPFHIKLRSNGYRVLVYFNGELKYENDTRRTAEGSPVQEPIDKILYHFRWGLYSNDPIIMPVLTNTVTDVMRK